MELHKQPEAEQRFIKNDEASQAYIRAEYPNEQFISNISELQSVNKYSKGLIIPARVRVAVSRIPVNAVQRAILRKELMQAEILARLGNSVYLIPEHGAYGEKLKDAVVNGQLFEFRTVTGNARTLEWEFGDAKKKGEDVNIFINVESGISKAEARRRMGLVLIRHPEYTRKIIISLMAGTKTCFWDSSQFLAKKTPPYGGSARRG